jgi:hypothetical protein
MSAEVKTNIVALRKAHMQSNGSYDNGENAIRTASSDDDDIESAYHF